MLGVDMIRDEIRKLNAVPHIPHIPQVPPKKKYIRLSEVENIIGFIVNIHDTTNFDIDLNIPDSIVERYKEVISNKYIYQDLGPNLGFKFDGNLISTSSVTNMV